jgi:single-strand DNA-binding protein
MNKVILVGKVAYPPRANDTNYGAVVNLMVTTTHRYKQNDGEIVERSQTNKAALWGKLAELNRDVQQGDLVSLEGRLQNKKVQDKSGVERWETEIVANQFETLVATTRSVPEQDAYDEPPPQTQTQEFDDSDVPF